MNNQNYDLIDVVGNLPEDHSSMGQTLPLNKREVDPLDHFDAYMENDSLYLGDGHQVYAVRKRDVAGEEMLFSESIGGLNSEKYEKIVSEKGFDQVVGYLESEFIDLTEDGFVKSPAEEPETPDLGWRTSSSDATISRALNE